MSKLFNEDDSESDCELRTDSQYAKNYNTWRKKEELNKLQTKYGSDVDDTSSSSDSDTDEDITNTVFDKDFFRVLSLLNSKDPRIYDKNFTLPKGQEEKAPKQKTKKKDPVYLKDYERKLLLETGGQLSEDEEHNMPLESKTYVEEQKLLKNSLKAALDEVDIGEAKESEEWGGLFKAREKNVDEIKQEDDEYALWLKGQKEHLEDEAIEKDLQPLKEYWSNPNLDSNEKFIRDYILNKKYTEKEDPNYIPTYNEIIHDSDGGLSEDEETLSKQEEFEHKYNYRYEEPDQEFLKRFPRTIKESVRKKDDKRAVQRHERKERKELEKKQKMDDLRQIRNLKRKEIEERLATLQEVTGSTALGFSAEDIDDDFDPVKHDEKMSKLFNEEFYGGPEGDIKPEFPELDEELEIEKWDTWKGNNEEDRELDDTQPHCEDDEFIMDCDYDPKSTQKELIESSRRRKKRKRKSKFAEALSVAKPIFDPNNKTYEEYLDEYYKLDCEDIIGDVPCRFKYRKVIPNSFGLSVEEILCAKDKELNKWCSLKKAVQYRPEHVEKYDVVAYEQKRDNYNLKRKCLPSLFVEESIEEKIVPSTSNVVTKEKIENKESQGKSKNALRKKKEKKEQIEVQAKDKYQEGNTSNTKKKTQNNAEEKEKTSQNIVDKGSQNKINKKKKQTAASSTVSSVITSENAIINNSGVIENVKKPEVDDSTTVVNKSKSTKKKNRKLQNQNNPNKLTTTPSLIINQDNNTVKNENSKKRKRQNVDVESKTKKSRREAKKSSKKATDVGISDARLKAYGFNPKKFKNKLKYKK